MATTGTQKTFAHGPHDHPQGPSHDQAMRFMANLTEIAQRSQEFIQLYLERQHLMPDAPPAADAANLGAAYAEFWSRLATNPAALVKAQCNFWQDYLRLLEATSKKFMGEASEPVITPDPRDKRFKDPAWQENIVFDFIKQAYLLSARSVQGTLQDAQGLEPQIAQKVDFYTRQFVDAMSPTNFAATNPEVLRATLESGGENLIEGLKHLLEDMEKGDDKLRIRMTDENAFTVGKNLAVTPGKVVYQNDLMQLLQYAPVTEKVHKTPLLVIPAWINKFYILDMQPDNSLVAYLVSQGFTVFMISWVNPDERLRDKTFDDYLMEGPLAALDAIEAATGERSVHILAYCLGGTLTSIALAYLEHMGEASRVKSASFLTTMTDFKEAGELSVFIDEEQLRGLEYRMNEKGYLDGREMAWTFNLLRANDLIWSFVINNYMLGKDPFPFDLLYWNSDATRMPALMHSFYLRNMYQKNLLMKPGGLSVAGIPIDLRTVKTPAYFLSAREDHIAPWKATYSTTQLFSGEKTFVLSASGHIAGVINPPAKKKYNFWTQNALPPSPDAWFKGARETAGSWWPHWVEWLKTRSKETTAARTPGDGKLTPIENAPGSYVRVRS